MTERTLREQIKSALETAISELRDYADTHPAYKEIADALALLDAHTAAQPAPVAVAEAVAAERERCLRIISAARNGDVDTDLRTLAHFIRDGDQMLYDDAEHRYYHDSDRADRDLIRSIEGVRT